MIAAMKGHKDIILMLMLRGANLNIVNQVSILFYINIILCYMYKPLKTEHKK